jgi:hypothetical protein
VALKRILAVANLLRIALQQNLIEPLHLLAAITGTEPGIGTQMFLDAGITPEEIVKSLRGE